jgi:hypothetical protein
MSKEQIITDEEIIRLVSISPTLSIAAKKAGMNYKTFWGRWNRLQERKKKEYNLYDLESKVSGLSKELKLAKLDSYSVEYIRKVVFGIRKQNISPPNWIIEPSKNSTNIGVPCLMLSDIHFGEIVDSKQVLGYNAYNMDIAEKRIEEIVQRTIDLLFNHMRDPNYDGIVLSLNGDLISGDIHEELSRSNEVPIMYAVAKLIKILIKVIELLQNKFKNVFVVVTSGNHSRITQKPMNKNLAYTSFDWLIGTELETYFQKDKRIQFLIPEGVDCQFKIYSTIFRQTHGQQFFSGNSGFVGPLAPIARGSIQKQIASIGCGNEYDVLLLAHFHRTFNLGGKVLCNGSIKGYDEYAYNKNMIPEPPMQTLFIVNKKRGITFTFNIQADKIENYLKDVSWISIEKR